LNKSIRLLKEWEKLQVINTDKNPAYVKAIQNLNKLGLCSDNLDHYQVKFHNNIIESEHGKLKRLIKPTLGFKSMKSAYATIKGFEVMRIFKKGQMDIWKYGQRIKGEIRIITDNLLAY
jgi:transposase-like protein